MGDVMIVLPGWLVAFLVFASGAMAATIFALLREQIRRKTFESLLDTKLAEQRSVLGGRMQPLATEIDAIQRGLAEFVALTHPELRGQISFSENAFSPRTA